MEVERGRVGVIEKDRGRKKEGDREREKGEETEGENEGVTSCV